MKVPNLSELVALAWSAFKDVASPLRVQPSVPILFFGDLKAYCASPLRVLTVGLNPSNEEFPKDKPFERFSPLEYHSQDRDPESYLRQPPDPDCCRRYLDAMSAYFETEPYRRWFSAFEPLLNGLGSSYYKNSEEGSSASSRALHTDICSPVATDPTWSGLDEATQKSLQKKGIPLWHRLLERLKPQIVVLSVAKRYLENIQFEPLTDWYAVHTFTKKSNGDTRSWPYTFLVRWYDIGGKKSMFVFGEARRTPLETLANCQKQEAGKLLLENYRQGCPELHFVQFPHPKWEHEPDDRNGKLRSWHNTHRTGRDGEDAWNPHKRQFMRLKGGEWIDEKWCKHADNLCAWGEWEPESIIIPDFKPPDNHPLTPQYLWNPYWVRRTSYSGLHNTDPFIFGDHFLYSNCYQISFPGMKKLAPGSLIVFGSSTEQNGEWKWMLDTVFVVRDSFLYDPRDPRKDLEGKVSDTFLEVVGGPLSSNPSEIKDGERFRLYRGVTPDEREQFGGMFSFFPAKLAGNKSGFRRPFIRLPGDYDYLNPTRFRSPSGVNRDISHDKLRELWDLIVTQVRSEGLVLGTHADLPPEGSL